jgi:hypothetical protein
MLWRTRTRIGFGFGRRGRRLRRMKAVEMEGFTDGGDTRMRSESLDRKVMTWNTWVVSLALMCSFRGTWRGMFFGPYD